MVKWKEYNFVNSITSFVIIVIEAAIITTAIIAIAAGLIKFSSWCWN